MSFEKVCGRLGFGCMRLPMKDGEVDTVEFSRMIDLFIAEGFNYFDTARGYLDGKSETALAECLVARYPRESFVLTNKLSDWCFEKHEDIRPFFESQLAACGVEYFDFYLMHAQNKHNYKKYKREGAYEEAFRLKEEGRVRHVGLSFHDTAEVLEGILNDYPDIELVQIQLNYYDYHDALVQSRACYDVCVRHGKPVVVMEPVKGGTLASLTPAARSVVGELGGSPASLAIRFAASLEGVFMTLSGMGNMDMMSENTSFMKDFKPVTEHEREVLFRTAEAMRKDNLIACTGCRYCVSGCPQGILIPDLFACLNDKVKFENWQGGYFYSNITKDTGKASDCIGCGACEESCPQRLPIRELLVRVKDTFEK
ncbi:MAG: aldo/keto reductase [Clostridia bacterium]|nr:aldo/keto reductase [Clostridia bacterium]